mgnify:CR=1 FL=1
MTRLHASKPLDTQKPIGVFDSGVGGLSILLAMQKAMPHESFVYVADSAHAPYGERDDAFVLKRAKEILHALKEKHDVKALVVACNTATAHAIHALREENPAWPIFGVEPAIKPASLISRTHRIGVMATAGTLRSQKFLQLLQTLPTQNEFVLQACEGLADAIEQRWRRDDDKDIVSLIDRYVQDMGLFGAGPGHIDTLVLGCTHYPFAASLISQAVGPQVTLIDTGEPVARRVKEVLKQASALQSHGKGRLTLLATGDTHNLQCAANAWLENPPVVSVG